MRSWTIPLHLMHVLKKYTNDHNLNISNEVAQAIVDRLRKAGVLKLDWDGVVAKNAKLYPKYPEASE